MKPSVLGLLIAAGAFGASTVYLAMQLEEERTRADEVAAQSAALNARIAELERARAQLESLRLTGGFGLSESLDPVEAEDEIAPRPAPAGNVARPVEPPVAAAEGPRPAGPGFERSEAMQKMLRTQMRSHYKRLHADIGTKLGLSKEDTNKLIDLMVDQQMENSRAARGDRGDGLTAEQRAAAREAREQQNLAEIGALIGGDRLEAYKAYQETMPARQEVDALSRQLEANDVGLSDSQRDRLVTALAEERRRVPAPTLATSGSREEYRQAMTAWQEDYQQRAASRASSILSADQQTAYAEYQQWNREMRQRFETRRSTREGGAGGPPGRPPR